MADPALIWRQASRWAGRQAVTWLLLASGVLGVVVIGIDLAADKWPSWSSVLMTPLWWWWAIRRISADVVPRPVKDTELSEDNQ